MDLNKISQEIRQILEDKRKSMCLTFEEDEHKYTMKDKNGKLRSDFPSVSKVIELFHDHFDAYGKSLSMCNGDVLKQEQLLLEWSQKGEFATNMGSMVHYHLEKNLIGLYGNYKEVRKPIFVCNEEQIERATKMIEGGDEFIKMMHKRGAVLLDTEVVLGSSELEFFGQPDKFWLYEQDGKLCLIVSDWKSNKIDNFKVKPFHNFMYEPFGHLWNNALGHYNIQLPFYAKLLIDMLKGTKYEDIKLLGCIIVLLKDDGTFEEFKVLKKTNDIVLDMDIVSYLNKKKELN